MQIYNLHNRYRSLNVCACDFIELQQSLLLLLYFTVHFDQCL